jgi:hypothetical protein
VRRPGLRAWRWLPMAALFLAACGGTSTAVVSSRPQLSSLPAASSLTVAAARGARLTVAVADARCPHRRGIGLNTAEWRSRAVDELKDYPALAAAMLANGDVLAIASGAPRPGTAIAAEFESPCRLDPRFGHHGVVELAMGQPGVSISTVYPTAGGGAILAGSTAQPNVFGQQWLVGRLTARGHPEHGFGRNGWRVLPWHGDVSSVAAARNGVIVLAGEDRPRVNGLSMVAELSAHGKLLTGFGTRGRAPLADYHDGGVEGVWTESGGDILVLLGGGNMGCWGVTATTLTPTGHRIASFTRRFLDSVEHFDASPDCTTPVFVGDLDADPNQFHLIGASQRTCVQGGCTEHPTSKPDPTRAARDIGFSDDGDLDTSFGAHGETEFRAPMAEGAWVLPQARGRALLVISPAGDLYRKTPAFLLIYSITRSGHLQARYGEHGVERVPLPFKTNDYQLPLDGGDALPVSNGRKMAVVANTSAGNTVIVIRA